MKKSERYLVNVAFFTMKDYWLNEEYDPSVGMYVYLDTRNMIESSMPIILLSEDDRLSIDDLQKMQEESNIVISVFYMRDYEDRLPAKEEQKKLYQEIEQRVSELNTDAIDKWFASKPQWVKNSQLCTRNII